MGIKKILFPTDFSEYTQAALQHATSLARDSGALLLIVHVKEPAVAFVDTGFAGYPLVENEADLTRMLNELKPTDNGVSYTHTLLTGAPADEVVEFADAEGVDMIVMGTHGRTGLTRLLMGSVAEAIVRRAKCPVLTIKQPDEAKLSA